MGGMLNFYSLAINEVLKRGSEAREASRRNRGQLIPAPPNGARGGGLWGQ
jgi:hypothetical protein